jgi:diguanylate cyclase (GGDEF)-like protein
LRRERQTILIVDDVPENVEIADAMLGGTYDTVCATNGRDAIAIASEQHPDLILLDVMMPDLGGLDVCARLKSNTRTRDIPVIFLTSLSDQADEAKGLDAGAIDYIAKPFNAPIVMARVRNHLELKRCRDELEQLTMTDALTGVANRRRGHAALDQEWRRALRKVLPLSLLMIDIDCFKQFNDRYGHPSGDDCLVQVAQALAAHVHRPTDLVARYGGEEFLCLLPETNAVGVREVAERLRDAVSALRIPHPGSNPTGYVTISIGCATAVPGGSLVAADLVRLADTMLYDAKRDGRNRVAASGWCDGVVLRLDTSPSQDIDPDIAARADPVRAAP